MRRIAFINSHPAKISKYGGLQPILESIFNREDTIGLIVHSMTNEIEKDATICQNEFASAKEYSLLDNCILAQEPYFEVILDASDFIEKEDISDFLSVKTDAPHFKSYSLWDLKKFRSPVLKMV